MKALRIHAGPAARLHLEQCGLQPGDVQVVPAAAGGPKGLILGPLDRFLFGQWLARSAQPVHLVGASIGAWRMATACLDDPVAAFERLEHDYIHQHYDLPPGRRRPSAQHVSERFGQSLQAFYGGKVAQVLQHPRYRLHIVTSRGRHILSREHGLATPLGYLGAFLSNAVRRKALGAWLERVVFSSPGPQASQVAALPFGTSDYPTRQVRLRPDNFMPALQASCSIPFVLQAVHHIPGAPPGAYWDGGITDYHLHLHYRTGPGLSAAPWAPAGASQGVDNAIDLGASRAYGQRAGVEKDPENGPENGLLGGPPSLPGGARPAGDVGGPVGAGLVLYPHFQHRVVPGWLDKGLKWRHRATAALDRMVVLSPSEEWVRSLPHGKLPDRRDFTHYGTDSAGRAKAWLAATRASEQLVDEWQAWLQRPDMDAVHAL